MDSLPDSVTKWLDHCTSIINDPSKYQYFKENLEMWSKAHGYIISTGQVFPSSIIPHVIKKSIFDQAMELGPIINKLVHNVSVDSEFLVSSYENIDDQFVLRLLGIYKRLIAQPHGIRQPLVLGLHRADYMIDADDTLIQIEINTISTALNFVASYIRHLQRYLMDLAYPLSPYSSVSKPYSNSNCNNIAIKIASYFNKAYHLYIDRYRPQPTLCSNTVILAVIHENELNSIDQHHLEYTLWYNFKIRMIFHTLDYLADHARLGSDGRLFLDDHYEVAIVYYRTAYNPGAYPSEKSWEARFLLEDSLAIKCPNIAYQLVGFKKMQYLFTFPELLQRFLSLEESLLLAKTFAHIYAIGDESQNLKKIFPAYKGWWSTKRLQSYQAGEDGEKRITACLQDYIMKPQREGGGNLLTLEEMKLALEIYDLNHLGNMIVMKRVRPKSQQSVVYKEGKLILKNLITEIGIISMYLAEGPTEKEPIINETIDYILRSKEEDVEDGGIVSGRAYMDTAYVITKEEEANNIDE